MDAMTEAAAQAADTMVIDIISDVVCPWCYIGKRQIEAALELWAAAHPEAPAAASAAGGRFSSIRSCRLNGMSAAGLREAQIRRRRAKAIYARVAGVGTEYGIPFAFDPIARQPNTVAAHSLIALRRREVGVQDARVKEAFPRPIFLDGRRSDRSRKLWSNSATAAGLDRAQAEAMLWLDPNRAKAVEQEDERARAIGRERRAVLHLQRAARGVGRASGGDAAPGHERGGATEVVMAKGIHRRR